MKSINKVDGKPLELTDEVLKSCEEFGGAHVSPKDLAIYLQAVESEVIEVIQSHPDHPVYQRYHAGRIRTDLTIRKRIFEMAERNSSSAQDTAMEMIMENKAHLA